MLQALCSQASAPKAQRARQKFLNAYRVPCPASSGILWAFPAPCGKFTPMKHNAFSMGSQSPGQPPPSNFSIAETTMFITLCDVHDFCMFVLRCSAIRWVGRVENNSVCSKLWIFILFRSRRQNLSMMVYFDPPPLSKFDNQI